MQEATGLRNAPQGESEVGSSLEEIAQQELQAKQRRRAAVQEISALKGML